MYRCVVALLLYQLCGASCELKWDIDNLAGCSYIYGQSGRERSRQDQRSPLLIWLGGPSESLQVSSKYGRLPLISLWRSYVNVIYITNCRDSSQQDIMKTGYFLDQWIAVASDERNKRAIYISGIERLLANRKSFLVAVAKDMLSRGHIVEGLFIGKPHFTPSLRFFGHRPFETGNKMNEYVISRAFNPVTCNSWHSQIEFVMNDLILYYTPEPVGQESDYPGDLKDMYDYKLSSVSSYDTCYTDMAQFEKDWRYHSPYREQVFPSLPRWGSPEEVFPVCDSIVLSKEYEDLLALNLTVYGYSFIRQESKPICSFYIGIFEPDGLRFPLNERIASSAAVASFNAASTYRIEDSWTRYVDEAVVNDRDTFTQLGILQDGTGPQLISENEFAADAADDNALIHVSGSGKLVWMQLDSRMDLKQKTGLLMLSKMTAVEILSRLIMKQGRSHTAVDYVDLFLV